MGGNWAVNVPWFSVVIPTYGEKGVGLTRTCVESLRRTHAHLTNAEIIIISDGPEGIDALAQIADEHKCILKEQERGGFAKACNLGLASANGTVVFLCNNDIEFIEPTTLQILTDCTAASNAGIIGTRLLYPNGTIQHGGVVFVSGGPEHPLPGWFDHLYRNEPALHPYAVSLRPTMVTGALLGITDWALLVCGFLDERFGFTCEDIDLNLRCLEAGKPPIYCGYTCAIHHEGATRGKTPEEKAQLAPDMLEKEIQSLERLFAKYQGFDWNQLGVMQI